MLLILLFGNHFEYTQLLSGEVMSSSQRFLPRLSRIGLEEKSISHVSDLGTSAVEASVSKSTTAVVSELVDGPTSASATSALHLSCLPKGCPAVRMRRTLYCWHCRLHKGL